jgi:Ca2+-binding RTX toxin-like protein
MNAINAFTGTVTGSVGVGSDTLIDITSVVGTAFDDLYDGSGFNSAVSGQGTFNEFEGGAGNDTIIGNGFTRAAYIGAGSGVNVNLATGIATGASTGTDSLGGVNAVRGSNFDDHLIGTLANETFEGRGGNDAIDAGDGFDLARYDIGASSGGSFVANAFNAITATAGGLGSDMLTGIDAIRGTNFDDAFDGSAWFFGYNFDGRGGNDTLIGSQGFDALLGGEGNDLLRGGQGSDVIDGGLGADRIDFDSLIDAFDTVNNFEAVTGGDVLDIADLLASSTSYAGGAGGPLASFVQLDTIGADALLLIDPDGAGLALSQALAILSGRAGLTLDMLVANGNLDTGPAGGATIHGTPGNDNLVGTPGNDTIIAFEGNDTLVGGAGNDSLDGGVIADLQSDIGFRDTDRADYSTAAGPVNVDLAAGSAQDGDGGTDTLIGIEAVNGSAFDDVLTGSSAFVEFYRGGAGNDTITGAGGNDRSEYANATAGVLIVAAGGGSAAFTVTGDGSVGTDSLDGVELFTGSDLVDTYIATGFLSASAPGGFLSNFNAFEGRSGNDSITGNGGTRLEFTGATSGVTVDFVLGSATGDASVGSDSFTGVNAVRGSSFADFLYGGNAASNGFESFDGRGGDDLIDGRSGFDRADYGINGPAVIGINVDLANGIVIGDPATMGTDTLRSVEGVRGSYLADAYNAIGFSNLSLNAGSSGTFNEFEGMAGDDSVIGNGSTRVSYASAREAVSVNLAMGTSSGGASTGSDSFSGVSAARGSNFDDTLIGSGGNDSLLGGEGGDLLRGGPGFDFIDGGNGADRIDFDSLGDAGDTIQGFAAFPGGDVLDIADLLVASTSYAGGAGGPITDFVRIEASGPNGWLQIDPDGAFGPAFWQTLATLNGGAALNVPMLLANGNLDIVSDTGITLIGGPGNDSLIGTPGNDTLVGNLGNDFLRGLGGNDLLDGGIVVDLQSDAGWRDFDRADYSTATSGVTVNLATGVALDGESGTDTLIGIEQVTGSAFADALTGSSAFSEGFIGGAGDDMIEGGGGFDRVDYFNATSAVTITLGALGGSANAAATVSSDLSVGLDTLNNVEQFNGSNFADTFFVGAFLSNSVPGGFLASFNSFEGRGGDDLITGNGATRAEYSSAATGVDVNLATGIARSVLPGGDPSVGQDTLIGVTEVRGSSFADVLTGGNLASDGFESFDGRGGNDSINGGTGWDRGDYAFVGSVAIGINVDLAGGMVTGDAALIGTDTLQSVEAIRGTHLADFYDATDFSGISPNAGSFGDLNEFQGMAGDDTITGNGNTRASYAFAREGVSVDMQAGTAMGGASVGADNFTGVNAVLGSNFDDVLVGSTGNDSLSGGLGSDLLRGGLGADFIDGGAGSDRIDFDSLLDASDAIANFEATPGGDVLDIADLLANSTSYAGGFGGLLSDFVQVQTAGGDAQLQIDANGSAGGANWETLATLLGDAGLDLTTLLTNSNLDIVI